MSATKLTVTETWVALTGIPQGAYLQNQSGDPLYYIYSDTTPTVPPGDPTTTLVTGSPALRSGNIWIASTGTCTASYKASDINDLKTLANLTTTDKSSVISAINEVNARLAAVSGLQYDEILITSLMISEKQCALSFAPITSTLQLTLLGCGLMDLNIDFIVEGDLVKWDALALEVLLQAGDKIVAVYSAGS